MTIRECAIEMQEFAMEIKIPDSIEVLHMVDKVRFRGTKNDIANFAQEFKRLKGLNDGQLCKLGNYVLKVSDYITSDRSKPNCIELPNHAWMIVGCKFLDVVSGFENNPFDFNDCGYTDKNPFDIGVEVTDLPLTFMEFKEDGTYYIKTVER